MQNSFANRTRAGPVEQGVGTLYRQQTKKGGGTIIVVGALAAPPAL
jgi:hypothetical protein